MMKSKQGVLTRQQRRTGAKGRTARHQRKVWLPYGLVGFGAIILVGLFVLSFSQAGANSAIPPRVATPLGNFTLTDIQGQKVQLSDYKGKVVLVNAWATWCPPCRAEMPDINAYYQAHQTDGFMVLAINAGDPLDKAASFAQSNNLAFPVLLDSNLSLLNSMGIHDFPTSIVIGRDGRVKHVQVGMFSPEALDSVVTPLLSQ
jgi:cytochrome c biogenesis protein CcmG, thiol:disulfide interchange protein DsbE